MATTIKCCGQELECVGFTNTCDVCDRDYNWGGQLLVSRQLWGEETGEHWADVSNLSFNEDIDCPPNKDW
jgi:hypothetical protein